MRLITLDDWTHEERLWYYEWRIRHNVALWEDIEVPEIRKGQSNKICLGCDRDSGAYGCSKLPIGWVQTEQKIHGTSKPMICYHCPNCYTRYGVGRVARYV